MILFQSNKPKTKALYTTTTNNNYEKTKEQNKEG